MIKVDGSGTADCEVNAMLSQPTLVVLPLLTSEMSVAPNMAGANGLLLPPPRNRAGLAATVDVEWLDKFVIDSCVIRFWVKLKRISKWYH